MPDARVIPIGKDPKGRTARRRKSTAPRPSGAPAARAARGSASAAAAVAPEAEEVPQRAPLPGAEPAPVAWDEKVAGLLGFLRRRVTGDYPVDEFGYDRELSDRVLLAPMRTLYSRWFRVETRGLENVPDTGGALVVANHSGTVALDSVMTSLALFDHHPARRPLRMLGADLVFKTPFLGEIARKTGSTLACSPDAERLLRNGQLVGVWPEGFKGVGKPFSERYKLQRFGRGGFVAAALKTKTPIIPCAIVGAEETYPIFGNVKTIARMFGLPYFPLTPTFPWLGPLGMVPLPSKWIIEFGEPIHTEAFPDGSADDPMLVFNLTDQVRETIQQTLYKLLVQRRSIFV